MYNTVCTCVLVCTCTLHFVHVRRYRKVSGDVCIEDPSSYLSSRAVPCPVKPPGELTVVSTSSNVGIGKTASFVLVQESVSVE